MSQKTVLTSEILETSQNLSEIYKSLFRSTVSRGVYHCECFLRNKIPLHHLGSKYPDERTVFSYYRFDSDQKLLGGNSKKYILGSI